MYLEAYAFNQAISGCVYSKVFRHCLSVYMYSLNKKKRGHHAPTQQVIDAYLLMP